MFMHLLLDGDLLADEVAPAPGEQLETDEGRIGLVLEQTEAVGGGTVDGRSGDHVLLAPPYIATSDDIEMIVDRLGTAVDSALKSIGY